MGTTMHTRYSPPGFVRSRLLQLPALALLGTPAKPALASRSRQHSAIARSLALLLVAVLPVCSLAFPAVSRQCDRVTAAT